MVARCGIWVWDWECLIRGQNARKNISVSEATKARTRTQCKTRRGGGRTSFFRAPAVTDDVEKKTPLVVAAAYFQVFLYVRWHARALWWVVVFACSRKNSTCDFSWGGRRTWRNSHKRMQIHTWRWPTLRSSFLESDVCFSATVSSCNAWYVKSTI